MEKLPADLRKALAAAPSMKAAWDDLTPVARRDFVSWIEAAKQPETRARRIGSLGSRLASGKRRPCCFAVVPMGLYRALDADPKAKTHWKSLSPDERRDVVDWISASGSETQKQRIEKACARLAAGKRLP